MNKFIGIGNLCKDLELRSTTSGKTCFQNTIAIRNDYKNANGQYDSEFVNIVCWGKIAEYVVQYAHKGMKIAVEGRLTNRSYDKADGTKGYITEIICNSVELLERKPQNVETESQIEQEVDPYAEYGEQINIDDDFLD